MKRVKLISSDPEFNGKEAFARVPGIKGVYFIDGKRIILPDALYSIQDRQPRTPDVVLINFNELPDDFFYPVLIERVKQDMYDCKERPCENNIERRLRALRQKGKLNYRELDHAKRILTKNVTEVVKKRVLSGYYQSTKTR